LEDHTLAQESSYHENVENNINFHEKHPLSPSESYEHDDGHLDESKRRLSSSHSNKIDEHHDFDDLSPLAMAYEEKENSRTLKDILHSDSAFHSENHSNDIHEEPKHELECDEKKFEGDNGKESYSHEKVENHTEVHELLDHLQDSFDSHQNMLLSHDPLKDSHHTEPFPYNPVMPSESPMDDHAEAKNLENIGIHGRPFDDMHILDGLLPTQNDHFKPLNDTCLDHYKPDQVSQNPDLFHDNNANPTDDDIDHLTHHDEQWLKHESHPESQFPNLTLSQPHEIEHLSYEPFDQPIHSFGSEFQDSHAPQPYHRDHHGEDIHDNDMSNDYRKLDSIHHEDNAEHYNTEHSQVQQSTHDDFDPVASWGHPLGLPVPVVPSDPAPKESIAHSKLSKPSAPPSKSKSAKEAPSSNKNVPSKPIPPKETNNKESGHGPSRPSTATNKLKTPSANHELKTPADSSRPETPRPTSARPATGAGPKAPIAKTTAATSASSKTTKTSAPAKPKATEAPAPAAKPVPPGTSAASVFGQLGKTAPFDKMAATYVDCAYVPAGGDPALVDMEFFKHVRSRYYILSCVNPPVNTLNALLAGKETWGDAGRALPVSLICTHKSAVLSSWTHENAVRLQELNIHVEPPADQCVLRLQTDSDEQDLVSAWRVIF
jgi:hypothetical protein